MLEKVYNPYAGGRWYRFFIETGDDYVITTSDIEDAAISSSVLKLPKGYRILEKCFDINPVAAFTLNISLKGYADGSQGVTLPAKTAFDYATVYLYCVKVEA